MSSILAVRNAIVATLAAQFADQTPAISVLPHGGSFSLPEVKRIGLRGPTIRVAFLGMPESTPVGLQTQALVQWGAFIITNDVVADGKKLPAGDLGIAIAEAIEGKLLRARWGVPNAGPVKAASVLNMYKSDLDAAGVALFGVEWTQVFTLDMSAPLNLGSLQTVDITYDRARGVPTDVVALEGSPS